MNPRAEEIRLRHLYRRLILSGRIRLPLEAAVKLVGPDCAYRLYRSLPGAQVEKAPPNPGRDEEARGPGDHPARPDE